MRYVLEDTRGSMLFRNRIAGYTTRVPQFQHKLETNLLQFYVLAK